MAIAQVQGSPTEAAQRVPLWTLSVGSLGVVYGDIGTSPLYALKESLSAASNGGPVPPGAVYGIVSLILWTLIVIVTIKYVVFLLRADNHGEGGTLTLMALAQRAVRSGAVITMLGMLSAIPKTPLHARLEALVTAAPVQLLTARQPVTGTSA